MAKNKYLTTDGQLKYQQMKSLLTTVNELYVKINEIAAECGIPMEGPGNYLKTPRLRTIYTPSDISFKVSRRFGVDISKKSKQPKIAKAKFAACYLLSKYTSMSLKEISMEVYNNDGHFNVINAKKRVGDFIDTDEDFKSKLESLESELEKEISLSNEVVQNH